MIFYVAWCRCRINEKQLVKVSWSWSFYKRLSILFRPLSPIPDIFLVLQRDDCGAGEAAGAVCDSRTNETLQEDEQNCFQDGVGYNPGDWIGGSGSDSKLVDQPTL